MVLDFYTFIVFTDWLTLSSSISKGNFYNTVSKTEMEMQNQEKEEDQTC